MDGDIGQVEDIYPEGGGIILDRGGDVHWLDCVRKLQEELDRLMQVVHMVKGRTCKGGTGGDELDRHARGKKVM
jgi:hypothetical protein